MTTTMTVDELRKARQGYVLAGRNAKSKYSARRVEVKGITFHSQREAARWQELMLMNQAGEVSNIRLQVAYPIVVNDVHVCTYIADFVYIETYRGISIEIVEDCKGYQTAVYRMKRKLMKAIYGIDIRES